MRPDVGLPSTDHPHAGGAGIRRHLEGPQLRPQQLGYLRWHQPGPLRRQCQLYALCAAVVCSLGYLPSLGFVHDGGTLPFVYDVADLYKHLTSIPAAFMAIRQNAGDDGELVRKFLKELTPPKTADFGEPTSSRLRQVTGKDCRMWISISFMVVDGGWLVSEAVGVGEAGLDIGEDGAEGVDVGWGHVGSQGVE
jgi:hypothetical protein